MSKRPADDLVSNQPITKIAAALLSAGTTVLHTHRTVYWCDSLAKYEGVDWIRGHHSVDSPEMKALLVAFALSQDNV